jgi:hypothetical protein
MIPKHYPNTPPTPQVARSKIHMKDLHCAVDRMIDAWNSTQVKEALSAIRFWCDEIENAVKEGK